MFTVHRRRRLKSKTSYVIFNCDAIQMHALKCYRNFLFDKHISSYLDRIDFLFFYHSKNRIPRF